MPHYKIYLICFFNAFFLYQGIDSIFFEWKETFWEAVESNQQSSWVMMASTMILTVLNAVIVMISIYYIAPNIDLRQWWCSWFRKKKSK